ncbi:MAG TPA: nucleotide exchange factor GrpE, partial [Actinomycetota bacterium]|nr:nucleotide exchange factor GrpE [Actinomycetota bacterium]
EGGAEAVPPAEAAAPAEAAPAAEGGPPVEAGPAAEVEALREELEEARRQAAEYRDHLQRLQAEFENYRKRVLKEQTRAVERAAEPLVRRLLEVLDEFELALMAAEDRPDFDRFLHGVELVYAKLVEALKAEGLERIEALGKPFDPAEHEALMQTGEGDGEPVVADVLRQGYRLRGHVIRPAGVKVTRS